MLEIWNILFFVLKKRTFWNPCIFAVYPLGMWNIWLLVGEGDMYMAHEKFINNA